MPSPSLEPVPIDWTVSETLVWIVYRGDQAGFDLPKLEQGRHTSTEIMAALQARVSGDPRAWRPPLTSDSGYAWRYRAAMKRWLRESGQTAPELLKDAQARRAQWEAARALVDEKDAKYAEALFVLNHRVALGKLTAWGRPSDNYNMPLAHKPREPIPAGIIDELRQIDATGCCSIASGRTGFKWLHDPGPFFYDTRFRVADVKKQWPVESEASKAKKPPSADALRKWWQSYLLQHPDIDKPPVAAQQKTDADAYFARLGDKGPALKAMRALRADPITSPEWRESGRRPKSR